MDRAKALALWDDMWKEGNWIPSWPDSLAGVTAEAATWRAGDGAHSIWQEVSHVTFWRQVTLDRMAGKAAPTDDEVERLEFAVPAEAAESAWAASLAALRETQDAISRAIPDESVDLERVIYHLIHDPYHLGRITQIRAMQGIAPKF